jgi:hypothetical protein
MTRGFVIPTAGCHSDGRRNLSFTYWVWFTERFFTPQAPFRMTRGSQAPFRMTRGLSFRRQEESFSRIGFHFTKRFLYRDFGIRMTRECHSDGRRNLSFTYWFSFHQKIPLPRLRYQNDKGFAGSVQNDKGFVIPTAGGIFLTYWGSVH